MDIVILVVVVVGFAWLIRIHYALKDLLGSIVEWMQRHE